MAKINIFIDQTVNGGSIPFIPSGSGIPANNDATRLDVSGNFDGASAQLQFLEDGGDPLDDNDWYSTGDPAFTTSGSSFFKDKNSYAAPYRLLLSGAGESTSISATVYNASTY